MMNCTDIPLHDAEDEEVGDVEAEDVSQAAGVIENIKGLCRSRKE